VERREKPSPLLQLLQQLFSLRIMGLKLEKSTEMPVLAEK
jgi:hypothetical protein